MSIEHKRITAIILESYKRASDWVYSAKEDFLRDLEDIEAVTRWAEEMVAAKMTLRVNW